MSEKQSKRGKARVPKAKKLTERQQYQADTAAGITGRRKVVKGGIVRWLKK